MARLSISIKNEIVRELEDEAANKGKTISSILSEAANLYLQTDKVGLRSEDVLKASKIVEIMREMNAIPIPGILLDNLIKLSWKNSEKEVEKGWYDRGMVLGNILRTYAKNFEDLLAFIKDYRFLIPIDLVEIETTGDNARVVLSGVGYSLQAAKCTSEGFRGLLEAYGYNADSVEISEGFVKINARGDRK